MRPLSFPAEPRRWLPAPLGSNGRGLGLPEHVLEYLPEHLDSPVLTIPVTHAKMAGTTTGYTNLLGDPSVHVPDALR